MPELPEVETTRRGLVPFMEGKRIAAVEVLRPRMARHNERPEDVVDRLSWRTLIRLGRHGKFIVGEVEGDLALIVHLGMSGRMQVGAPSDERPPHTNVIFLMDSGVEIRFIDPRTFGFVAVLTPEELAHSSVSMLGPDALDDLPRSNALASVLAGRTVAIKTLLLNQSVIAGLGNIYADEVLSRAGIRPDRPAGSLSGEEIKRLRASIRPVLEAGLRHGGTSLDDLAYLLPDGRAGEYVARLKVYGRDGLPCRRCGTPIERMVLAARSSHFCPACQV